MEDLKGQIYRVRTVLQANQLITKTKVIVGYLVQTYTNPQGIRISIEKLDDVMISIPNKQEDIKYNIVKLLIGKEIDAYVKRIKM